MTEAAAGSGMTTPEGEVKKALKKILKPHEDEKTLYAFWAVQTGYGKRTLDCLVCWRGLFIGVECKREGVEEPAPHQDTIMKAIRAAGGRTFLVTMEKGALKWIEINS